MPTIYIFRACFENTDIQQSKTIIKELLAYIGAGDANDAQSALNILSALAIKHPEKIRPVASMLRVSIWNVNHKFWMRRSTIVNWSEEYENEQKFFCPKKSKLSKVYKV